MIRTLKNILSAAMLVYLMSTSFLAIAIETPSNTRAAQINGSTIIWEWDAVEGAAGYEVTVDGGYVDTTQATQWQSDGLWVGDHSMTVKAIDNAGNRSEQSLTAKVYVQSLSVQAESDSSSFSPPPQAADNSLIDPASYQYPEVTSKANYDLVFSDEFNGYELNPARWHSQLRWDGEWNGERYEYRIINGEDQFYVNVLSPDDEHQREIVSVANPFEFDGSRLAIRAKRNPLKSSNGTKTHGKLMDIARQQPFLSGAISTHQKFSRKYGYFEARIKIPSHVGTFPAFWLFHERRAWEGTQRTEIDIMENLGHAPWYIYNSFHYFKNVSEYYSGDVNSIKPKPSGQVFTGIDYSQNYHVYSVEWEPGKITWFIDGVKTSELENSEANFEDLYLMLNLAIGGNWTNFPTNAGGLGRPGEQHFPTDQDINEFGNPALEIDYVRVYKKR